MIRSKSSTYDVMSHSDHVQPERAIAYFSMEIALEPGIPTYSGGLGVLAGDTLRSAADLKVPMVAVTLLHRKGYFYQQLDPSGWQQEEPVVWDPNDFLQELPQRASVTIDEPSHDRSARAVLRSGRQVTPMFTRCDSHILIASISNCATRFGRAAMERSW